MGAYKRIVVKMGEYINGPLFPLGVYYSEFRLLNFSTKHSVSYSLYSYTSIGDHE